MKVVQSLSLVALVCGLVGSGLQALPAMAQTPPVKPAAPAAPAPAQPAAPAKGPLSKKEVAERLNIVPVFAIVSKDGTPILANQPTKDGKTVQVVSFWLDQTQANETIKQIKTSNPDIATQAQVIPMSLGYAYEVAEKEKPKNSNIVFQVLPRQSDVQSAMTIVKANGQSDIKDFPGVPLFYGMSDQGLLTIEKDGVEIVPFFFDQADLKSALQRAAGSSPDVVKKTKIEVTTLEQVVNSMMAKDAKTDVNKIAFVPARAALEYLRTLSPQGTVKPPAAGGAPVPVAPAPVAPAATPKP